MTLIIVALAMGYFAISIGISRIMAKFLGVVQPNDEDRLMLGFIGLIWPLTLIGMLAWAIGNIATRNANWEELR